MGLRLLVLILFWLIVPSFSNGQTKKPPLGIDKRIVQEFKLRSLDKVCSMEGCRIFLWVHVRERTLELFGFPHALVTVQLDASGAMTHPTVKFLFTDTFFSITDLRNPDEFEAEEGGEETIEDIRTTLSRSHFLDKVVIRCPAGKCDALFR